MSLVQRTSQYLQPSHERFEPLPVAAALLNPASEGQLLSLADREDLVEAAKAFIKDMSQSQLWNLQWLSILHKVRMMRISQALHMTLLKMLKQRDRATHH